MSSRRVLSGRSLEGGLAGTINYILNSNAHKNTSGWAAYADAAAAAPVDGTGGSPVLTFTRSTSTPLRGDGSFLLTTTATNRQGEGASFAFTIDTTDQAKVLSIEFDYAFDVTQATGDWAVYIYDVTNGALIQPAGYQIQGGVSGTYYKHIGTFQTASNSTSYRLIIHRAVTTATAVNFKIDNVRVGPQVVQYGAPVTDWVSYTPSVSNVTTSSTSVRYRRIGDTAIIKGSITYSAAPTGTVEVSFPTGLSIDTTKHDTNGFAGKCDYYDQSANANYVGYAIVNTSSKIRFYGENQTNEASPVGGTLFDSNTPVASPASGDIIEFYLEVPISGWSSNTQMSNDTDTRVVAVEYNSNGGTGITADTTNITWSTKVVDTHSAWSGTVFTAPISGNYVVLASSYYTTTTNSRLDMYKNGSLYGTIATTGAADSVKVGSGQIYLNAGDTLSIRSSATLTLQSASSSTFHRIAINRVSGPSAIAASESVNMRYGTSNAQAITTGSNPVITTWTQQYDSHGAFNATTGVYTVPVSGKYRVTATISSTSTAWTTGSGRYFYLSMTGSKTRALNLVPVWASQTTPVMVHGSTTETFTAGQTISISLSNTSGSTFTLDGATDDNWICIERVGN